MKLPQGIFITVNPPGSRYRSKPAVFSILDTVFGPVKVIITRRSKLMWILDRNTAGETSLFNYHSRVHVEGSFFF